MSVPVNKRTQGRMEVHVKSRNPATYTLQITKNKKVFTEDYQDAIIDKIIATALNIHCLAWGANFLNIDNPDEAAQRRIMQNNAISQCTVLLGLIDIAKPLFHLTTKREIYWSGMALETRKLLRSWRDSDKKRSRS